MMTVIINVVTIILSTIAAIMGTLLIGQIVAGIITKYNLKKYNSWMGKMNINGTLYKIVNFLN